MKKTENERIQLLREINEIVEKPLIIFSLVWLILILVEFIYGLHPLLEIFTYIIWGLFILDFLIEFIIAPKKGQYLKRNILTVFSLFLPALRLFRMFRALSILRASRAIRSVNLIKILTSFNRGIRTFRNVLKGKGIGYISVLTIFIIFLGAAGMAYFEDGISNYGDAVWFTAMLMTTLGSEYWPVTLEGRILTFLLSLYALAIFGYITATIASILLGKENKIV